MSLHAPQCGHGVQCVVFRDGSGLQLVCGCSPAVHSSVFQVAGRSAMDLVGHGYSSKGFLLGGCRGGAQSICYGNTLTRNTGIILRSTSSSSPDTAEAEADALSSHHGGGHKRCRDSCCSNRGLPPLPVTPLRSLLDDACPQVDTPRQCAAAVGVVCRVGEKDETSLEGIHICITGQTGQKISGCTCICRAPLRLLQTDRPDTLGAGCPAPHTVSSTKPESVWARSGPDPSTWLNPKRERWALGLSLVRSEPEDRRKPAWLPERDQ